MTYEKIAWCHEPHAVLYLAARWEERERMRLVRSLLCAAGFGVRASWLDQRGPSDEAEPASFERRRAFEWADFYREAADNDLRDVRSCDALVLFETGADGGRGKYVEMGYALGKGKPVFVVGGPRLVFAMGSGVTLCEGLTGLVAALHARFWICRSAPEDPATERMAHMLFEEDKK